MRITIEIDTENDAFQPSYGFRENVYSYAEYTNILHQINDTLFEHRTDTLAWESVLFDSNGSRCGFVRGEYD